MYSSLDKMDIVAKDRDGRELAFQTDHREAHEIEEEPEISVLFALTRVIGPRQAMASQGTPLGGVVYSVQHEPPAFLVEALASVGAVLEITGGARRTLAPVEVTPEVVAERAFTGLAARKYTVRVTLPENWGPGGKNGTGAFRNVVLKPRLRKPAEPDDSQPPLV